MATTALDRDDDQKKVDSEDEDLIGIDFGDDEFVDPLLEKEEK